MNEEKSKVDVNVVQVAASALAAVTSAVLLSTLGTAGTIIGAALGSVIATVGAALYSYSLRVSRERMQAAQAAAVARMSRVRTGVHTRQIELEDRPADQGRAPWREALGRLPWKWIAIITGAVFVVAMIIIIGFELVTGRSVSTYTGGSDGAGHRTSVGFGTASTPSATPSKTPSKTPGASPSKTSGQTPGRTRSGTATSSANPSSPARQRTSAAASPSASASAPTSTPSPSTTLQSPTATPTP